MRRSFTEQVVAELAPHVPLLRCCRRALLDGMLLVSGTPGAINTTRLAAARAAVHTLHTDSVPAHLRHVVAPRRPRYQLQVPADTPAVASQQLCCSRSRLRGAFLAGGRLQQPDAGPYLEIDCPTQHAADTLRGDAATLGIPTRVRARRGHPVLTIRSATALGAALSSMGAQSGRLEYEAGRVVRDVRAGVNRQLNAETANLRRAAGAGVLQLEAAEALAADATRWARLPAAVREAAALRRRHPHEDLASLARRASCSRSAMAGRLHRLVALASGT